MSFELRKINEDPNEEGFTQLVRSIGLHGLLQPIVLRPHPSYKNKKRYQVIAGGRRFRASKRSKAASPQHRDRFVHFHRKWVPVSRREIERCWQGTSN
jgi:hypothetical protein